MIWAEAPADKPYNLPDYDPIWAAAQEHDFPLSLHVLTGRKGTGVDFFSGNLACAGLYAASRGGTLAGSVCPRWSAGTVP